MHEAETALNLKLASLKIQTPENKSLAGNGPKKRMRILMGFTAYCNLVQQHKPCIFNRKISFKTSPEFSLFFE